MKILIFKLLAIIIGVFIIFFSVVRTTKSEGQDLNNLCYQQHKFLIDQVNYVRQQNGKSTLLVDYRLCNSAKEKADDIRNRGYWAHISPDGVQGYNLMLKQGATYYHRGENLARWFYDDQKVINAWILSRTHFLNMTSDNCQYIGIGRNNDIVVLHLGGL